MQDLLYMNRHFADNGGKQLYFIFGRSGAVEIDPFLQKPYSTILYEDKDFLAKEPIGKLLLSHS